MPIPFLLGAAALLAGGYGVKKGVDAYEANEDAEMYERWAENLKKETISAQRTAKDNLDRQVRIFGRYRCESLQCTVGAFIKIHEQLSKNGKVKEKEFDVPQGVDMRNISMSEMRQISLNASQVLNAIGDAGTAGAVVYGGVLGAVGVFGTASTGTAIAGLSGAAATNAALAACGGGSLAAGGLGMAGGAALLGAATGGVALAVVGAFASSHFEKKKENAKTYYYNVKRECEKVDSGTELLKRIGRRVDELHNVTVGLTNRARTVLTKLEVRLPYFNQSNDYDMRLYQESAILCKQISLLAETPLIDKNGVLTSESDNMIIKSRKLLNTQL